MMQVWQRGDARTTAVVDAGACCLLMPELVCSCLRLGDTEAGAVGWLQVWLTSASLSRGIYQKVLREDQR